LRPTFISFLNGDRVDDGEEVPLEEKTLCFGWQSIVYGDESVKYIEL
jgi:hypothetical protein